MTDKPETAYKRAMDAQAALELECWVAAHRILTALQGIAIIAGSIWAMWAGMKALILCGGIAYGFQCFKPAPTETLDNYTDRKAR